MSLHTGRESVYFVNYGKLWGCGRNYDCELGQGNRTPVVCLPVEIKIPGSPKILKFNQGLSNSTFVLTTQGLFGCGEGNNGQFFDGKEVIRREMSLVEYFKDGREVKDYFSEGYALWVILKNHQVVRCGWNYLQTLGDGKNKDIKIPTMLDTSFLGFHEFVVDIKSDNHTLLLTNKGRVFGCGSYNEGQLGTGRTQTDYVEGAKFEKIKFFEEKKEKVIQISVGGSHSMFIVEGQKAYSCGINSHGELGLNTTTRRLIPTRIVWLEYERVRKVETGGSHSLFLSESSEVFSCGRNNNYQLGHPKSTQDILVPTKVFTTFIPVDISANISSSLFVSCSGEVFSVGSNTKGQGCVGYESPYLKELTKTKVKIKLVRTGTLFKNKPEKLLNLIISVLSNFESRGANSRRTCTVVEN